MSNQQSLPSEYPFSLSNSNSSLTFLPNRLSVPSTMAPTAWVKWPTSSPKLVIISSVSQLAGNTSWTTISGEHSTVPTLRPMICWSRDAWQRVLLAWLISITMRGGMEQLLDRVDQRMRSSLVCGANWRRSISRIRRLSLDWWMNLTVRVFFFFRGAEREVEERRKKG